MYTYPNVPRCHYIKINGTRCGSPGQRNQKLCYFHQRWHEQHIPMGMSHTHSLELPVLEDANSIQMAITPVMRLDLSQIITLKEAGILFYGLQIAASNLKRTNFNVSNEKQVVIDPATLDQTGVGVDAWTPADFPDPIQPAPEAESEARFTPDPAQPVYDFDHNPTPPPKPTIIPDLKAQAEDAHVERACPELAEGSSAVRSSEARLTCAVPRSDIHPRKSAAKKFRAAPTTPTAGPLRQAQGRLSTTPMAPLRRPSSPIAMTYRGPTRSLFGTTGCDASH